MNHGEAAGQPRYRQRRRSKENNIGAHWSDLPLGSREAHELAKNQFVKNCVCVRNQLTNSTTIFLYGRTAAMQTR